MKIVAIINGKNRNAEKIKTEIEQKFAEFSPTCLITQKGQAFQIAKNATINGTETIIAAGGDGTIHEIANGILQTNMEISKLPAIAPYTAGTGNDLARSINLGNNLDKIKQKIVSNQWQIMDTAEITYQNFSGNTAKRYFINMADLGIGAQAINRIANRKKIYNGTIAYSQAAIASFFTQKAVNVIVTSKDFEFKGLSTEICIGNGKYFGGGFGISPYSNPFDSRLELLIVKKMNTARFIPLIKKMRDAKPIMINEFLYKRIINCNIESLAKHQHIVEADGELLGTTPIQIKIASAALKIFANTK